MTTTIDVHRVPPNIVKTTIDVHQAPPSTVTTTIDMHQAPPNIVKTTIDVHQVLPSTVITLRFRLTDMHQAPLRTTMAIKAQLMGEGLQMQMCMELVLTKRYTAKTMLVTKTVGKGITFALT